MFPTVLKLEKLSQLQIRVIFSIFYLLLFASVAILIPSHFWVKTHEFQNIKCPNGTVYVNDEVKYYGCLRNSSGNTEWNGICNLNSLELFFSVFMSSRILPNENSLPTSGWSPYEVKVFGVNNSNVSLTEDIPGKEVYSSTDKFLWKCGSDSCRNRLLNEGYGLLQNSIYEVYYIRIAFSEDMLDHLDVSFTLFHHYSSVRLINAVGRVIFIIISIFVLILWKMDLKRAAKLQEHRWISFMLFYLILFQNPAYIFKLIFPTSAGFLISFLCFFIGILCLLIFWLFLFHGLYVESRNLFDNWKIWISFYAPKIFFVVLFLASAICFVLNLMYNEPHEVVLYFLFGTTSVVFTVLLFYFSFKASNHLDTLAYVATRHKQLTYRFLSMINIAIYIYFIIDVLLFIYVELTNSNGLFMFSDEISTLLFISVYVYMIVYVYAPVETSLLEKAVRMGSDAGGELDLHNALMESSPKNTFAAEQKSLKSLYFKLRNDLKCSSETDYILMDDKEGWDTNPGESGKNFAAAFDEFEFKEGTVYNEGLLEQKNSFAEQIKRSLTGGFDPSIKSDNFSLITAFWLLYFANQAYFDFPGCHRTVSGQGEVDIVRSAFGFKMVKFFTDLKNDVNAFIAKRDHIVVIAFRGTASVRNMVLDLRFKRSTLAGAPGKADGFSEEVKIHKGFWESYSGVKHDILSVMEELNRHSYRPLKVFCTGHSLGGALATLTSFSLRSIFKLDVSLYSYGAPRIGDHVFAKNFDSVVPHSFRIVMDRDIIPSTPKLFCAFKHIGKEILVDEGGNYITEPPFIDKLLKGGRGGVKHHSVKTYHSALKKACIINRRILESLEEYFESPAEGNEGGNSSGISSVFSTNMTTGVTYDEMVEISILGQKIKISNDLDTLFI